MAGRAVAVARRRLHQGTGHGDGGLLLLINGTLVGVGGVFLATASVLVTGIAAAAAVALAVVVTSADRRPARAPAQVDENGEPASEPSGSGQQPGHTGGLSSAEGSATAG